MTVSDLSWMIGGPQGSGVDSSATLFARVAASAGYPLYGKKEYHSNIKGEHSYFQVRVKSEGPVQSHLDPLHVLATFEDSTAVIHAHEIVEDGALIYDPKVTNPEALEMTSSVRCFAIPYDELIQKLAEETGESPAKLIIVKNVLAVGASMALIGLDISALEYALSSLFTGRRAKLVPLNVKAGTLAYNYMKEQTGCSEFNYKLEPAKQNPERGKTLVLTGAEACGMGKLLAGCRFQSYYSITPAVDECIYLEGHTEYGIIVFQAEDEIAAVNMAISASLTGARSSCSTSGPGFSLKAEGMGWAGINEVPVVVFDYMRGGPSTGLPTRNEQGELLFAIYSGHGEYPRIVLAPGDIEECFYLSYEAFNMADRYQTPVVMLVDKALANSTQSLPVFKTDHLRVDRGKIVKQGPDYKEGDIESAIARYPRYRIDEDSPISPRPYLGTPGTIFWMTGDEHDEYGHITEEPDIRLPMHDKRMRKMDVAAREIPEDLQYTLYGPQDADLTVVSWGSSKGAVLDAMRVLEAKHNIRINSLHIRVMNPFPTEAVKRILESAKQVMLVESNYTSQLGQLIRMRTGFDIQHHVNKWTGRPISEDEIIQAVRDVVENQAKKVVLTYGH